MQLDADQVTFIQGGVAIDLATRDPRNIPRVARGVGCRVTADRNRLTVLVPNQKVERFIDALQVTRSIAVVFCLASTHRAMQIKGSDAQIEAPLDTDVDLIERAIAAFASDMIPNGFTEEQVRIELNCLPTPGEVIAISFTPEAIFEQTPGPRAGMPV